MLSQEDNEYLCRVGPGTPMGQLMRQYWIPAIRSDEVVPDGRPIRVRLLCEDLIGFRSTDGKVGLVQNNCPHRGASLFFGRNEEEGLRCVYHGWKFDVSGRCVDMPNEPAESNFKDKVRANAYATTERGGIIWAYMGPRETPPPLPDLEATIVNTETKNLSLIRRACNWMQGLEGELDTVHAAFLHGGATKPETLDKHSFNYYQYSQRAPRFHVLDTAWGTSYGAYRPAEADTEYWRIAHFLFPFYAMQPTGTMGENAKLNAYVPIDDENLMQWECHIEMSGKGSRFGQGGRGEYKPTTTDWLGRFNLVQDWSNDFLRDYEAQKRWDSYSGIPGIRQQDMAVTESMGPIYKRWQEHLGTTDVMIIRTRRRLIQAAKALEEKGVLPPGVDQPEVYRVRSGECVLPKGQNWWEASTNRREAWGVAQPSGD